MNNMLGNEVYQPREWIFANKKTAVRLRKVKDNPIPGKAGCGKQSDRISLLPL